MNTLQKMFESVLLERGKKAMIDRAIQLIERKVKRAGASLTKSQKNPTPKPAAIGAIFVHDVAFQGKSRVSFEEHYLHKERL